MIHWYPGKTAAGALRVFGVINLIAASIVAIWVWSNYSTKLGVILGLGFILEALLVCIFFFVVADISDRIAELRINALGPFQGMWQCERCNHWNGPSQELGCINCSTPRKLKEQEIQNTIWQCPNCHQVNDAGRLICSHCGYEPTQ